MAGEDYGRAGVVSAGEMGSFGKMLGLLGRTFNYPTHGRPVAGFGPYANVLDLGGNLGLAIATDGVGTKLLVAEELGKCDTVGIDCVAMNVNDIVCVGAEPVAMVDYIAVQDARGDLLYEIARGLEAGARLAHISIPGGEIAQLPEMLRGVREGDSFDLVGACVGTVPLDRIVSGERVEPGDVLIGFSSSGMHSNGFTLARRVFQQAGWAFNRYVEDFGRTLGEELLEPTAIYVDLALDLLRATDVRALMHITGDGLLNLQRIQAACGFDIDGLPDPPPVFQVLQRLGQVEAAEMYRVFNMGVGFCAVVPDTEVVAAHAAARLAGFRSYTLGAATASAERRIRLLSHGLASGNGRFEPVS
jgi:phosphoribosylformylglycinamidine cyclo-ligase